MTTKELEKVIYYESYVVINPGVTGLNKKDLISEGDRAPAFTLPGAGLEKISLSKFKGKKVVLYFYPKDDTSGCTKESLEFSGLKDKFARAGTVVIGLSPDPVVKHVKFQEKYNLSQPLASDESKETLLAYGVWIEKSMYGRKYMGIDRATFLIDVSGKINHIWRKVSVTNHGKEVENAIRALKGDTTAKIEVKATVKAKKENRIKKENSFA
jgi:peroxiredoxin Q/BCP